VKGLCTNCMDYGCISGVPVGHERGHQRDPYREQILLCSACAGALIRGSLRIFHERYVSSNTVSRDDLEPLVKRET
jgi:hypothetical protein